MENPLISLVLFFDLSLETHQNTLDPVHFRPPSPSSSSISLSISKVSIYIKLSQYHTLPPSFKAFLANFSQEVASLSKAQAKKVALFLPNPKSHWGPKLRARRTITGKHASLIGPQKVNGILNDNEEQGEESEAKLVRRHKSLLTIS